MRELLLVAIGGAAGSVARWLLSMWVDARLVTLWPGFPWGTLVVNISGCLAIGVLSAWVIQPWVRHLLMIGVMGGFTTFSSFALQTAQLNGAGAQAQAFAYIAASVVLCLIAVWLGMQLGGQITAWHARGPA